MAARQRRKRPSRERYYMGLAMAVRKRANCVGNRIGAVLVVNDRIVSTGYNGTPNDMGNCDEGGCERCANRKKYGAGKGYDVCICVHAEQNVILTAARLGSHVEDGVLYTTKRPCFGCTKELLQAGIKAVYYRWGWKHPDHEVWTEYENLQNRFPEGMRQVNMPDPDKDWAEPPATPVPQESGHTIPRG